MGVAEPDERLGQEDDAERRIARARSAIGKSFEELIARGEAGATQSSGFGSDRPPGPPPDIEAEPAPTVSAAGFGEHGTVDDIAASVESRISAWVEERVRAAERRLQLQSEAFEAALGDEVVGTRLATEQAEAARRSLAAAAERALVEVRAAAEAAAGEIGGRLSILEQRVESVAGDQQAAVEARFAAVEAALRSRLNAALDETATGQDARMREEAADQRRRINEELTAALQSTATELRRQLEADREGARREFSGVAREEIAAAVERLEGLQSAAVREARGAAEAVAASHLSDVRAQIARQLYALRTESREDIDRGLSALDSRLRESFDGLRGEREAAGAAREAEIRRRVEARIDELAGQLSAGVQREVARRFAETQADLERFNAEVAERARFEGRAGAEAAINLELAKGEARLSAASERIEVIADDARTSAAAAAAEARQQALAEIPEAVAAAVEEAGSGARAEIDGLVREAAGSALSDQADRVGAELEQAAAAGIESRLTAFGDELSRSSYRDHSRRAEAAAASQLARSLDALKQQRVELGADLASSGAEERDRIERERTRVEAELERSLAAAKEDLERRATELRAATETAIATRADRLLADGFERGAAELEGRLDALVARKGDEASRRFAAAAANAGERLAAVERAQQREERVRERIDAAEREAEQRVRDAERRLVEVLGRIGPSAGPTS